VNTFRCRVALTVGAFELHAEPRHSSYHVTDLSTGRVSSYDDTRERITSGTVVPVLPYQVISEALLARLA
jgi:hypothetical protein